MLNLARRIKRIESQSKRSIHSYEYGCVNLINKSGVILYPGNIVVLAWEFSYGVELATVQGSQAPMVVLDESKPETNVKCTKKGYGIIEVVCDGPYILPCDAIVTSPTPSYGMIDNSVYTTALNFLGFALEPKEDLEVKAISILV